MSERFNPYAKAPFVTVDKRTGEPFNPPDFGREGKSGRRPKSARDKVFNQQATLNASDSGEVLDKIKGLLDGAASGEYQVTNQPFTMQAGLQITAEESESILRQAYSDPTSEGFRTTGQALLNPIKEVIDYEGVTRKIWVGRDVKQGEVLRYDKDVFVVGYVIAEDGQTPQSQVEGKYVYPPEFEVSAYPTIELKDQYRAQYDILARAQDRSRQAIEFQEDQAGANLLLAAGNTENATTFFATMNVAAVEAMKYQVERHRLAADKLLINRAEVSDFVNTIRGQVDPVTQRELVMAGFIGTFLNMMIITTAGTNTYEFLHPGEAIVVTTPEYLGGFAVRQALMSEPVTEMHEGKPRRGWYWWEMVALALINPKGVALGSKT